MGIGPKTQQTQQTQQDFPVAPLGQGQTELTSKGTKIGKENSHVRGCRE